MPKKYGGVGGPALISTSGLLQSFNSRKQPGFCVWQIAVAFSSIFSCFRVVL